MHMKRREFRNKLIKLSETEKSLMNNRRKPLNIDYHPQKDEDGVFLFPAMKQDKNRKFVDDAEEFNFTLLDGKLIINKQIRFLDIPMHRHEYIGINFIYSGNACLIVNGKKYAVSEGDTCLMDSGVAHTIKYLGESDIIFNILIDPSFFSDSILLRIANGEAVTEFVINAIKKRKESEQLYLIHTKNNLRLRNYFEDLFIEAMNPGLCSDEFITAQIELILIEMIRHYHIESKIVSRQKNAIGVLDMLKYIDENALSTSLKDVSERFNFSTKHISRLIKNETGKSFKSLQEEYRLNKALILLLNSDLSIGDIAVESGYSNLNFFYNKFKAKYNTTPGEYRSKIRRNFGSNEE